MYIYIDICIYAIQPDVATRQVCSTGGFLGQHLSVNDRRSDASMGLRIRLKVKMCTGVVYHCSYIEKRAGAVMLTFNNAALTLCACRSLLVVDTCGSSELAA